MPRPDSDTQSTVWDEALDWLLLVEAAPKDAKLRGELEQWLARGHAQRAAYARAQEVWRLTGQDPAGNIKADDIPAAAIPPRQARHPAESRARVARWIAAAVVAAGLLLAGLPYLRVHILADYHTDVGETRQVALPDGSVVTLDSGSAIDLGGALAGKAGDRTVTLLAGRAYFEVAHDDALPFAAKAEDVTVEVHGTAFDLGRAKSGISVALAQGAV
ncbi:MAG TPA: FecR domain-containing protein, partial [Dongiaceae bacterium]|nr:FecR domain-containing protein [Dongiaceae bacterium]